MIRARTRFGVSVAAVAFLAAAGRAEAGLIVDPTNDFLPTYTAGPKNGDMDVTGVGVTFDGSRFVLTATLNGPLGTTPGTLYVFGVDRGQGTARFGALAPGVLFDSVVILKADGTGTVNRIVGGGSSALSAGDVTVSGDTITATVLDSLLPSLGRAPADYTFNLWPRLGAGNNNQISDFAPDNANIGVTATPEPSTLVLAGVAVPLALAYGWRKRGRSRA